MKYKKTIPELEALKNLLGDQEKPLTLAKAAKYLGFSKSYLYKLTSKQEIPHYKPSGKVIFFLKKDLDEWITRNKY